MHLGRPVVDAESADVAVEALQHEVARDATSAADLYRTVDDAADRLGDEDLAHRRFLSRLLATFQLFGGVEDHQPRGVQFDCRIGDHPLQRLVLGEELAEGGALPHVVGADFQCSHGSAEPAHAVRQPRRPEAGLPQRKAPGKAAEALVPPDTAILQETLAVSARPAAAHCRDAADNLPSGVVGIDEKERGPVLGRAFGSVTAATMAKAAPAAPLVNHLWPLMTH